MWDTPLVWVDKMKVTKTQFFSYRMNKLNSALGFVFNWAIQFPLRHVLPVSFWDRNGKNLIQSHTTHIFIKQAGINMTSSMQCSPQARLSRTHLLIWSHGRAIMSPWVYLLLLLWRWWILTNTHTRERECHAVLNIQKESWRQQPQTLDQLLLSLRWYGQSSWSSHFREITFQSFILITSLDKGGI